MRIFTRVLIGIGISSLLLLTFIKGTWEKFELSFYDWRLKYTLPEKENIPLVIVGITERFEKKTGEKFSRKFHSKLIKILQKEGASLIAYDIFFPDIKNKKVDEELMKTIRESKIVILPVFSPSKLSERMGIYYKVKSLRGSYEKFNISAISVGHINTMPDGDQIVRKMPAFLVYGKKLYPQISLQVARIYWKKKGEIDKLRNLNRMKYIWEDGCFYIRYYSSDFIKRYFIPFSDVINGEYRKGRFKNKVVIVGQTILGAKNADLIPTPLGTEFGVFVQANALTNFLSGNFILRFSRKWISFFLIIYGIFVSMLFFSKKYSLNTFYLIILLFSLTFISTGAMLKWGIFIDTIPFYISTSIFYIVSLGYSLVSAVKRVFQKESALKVLRDVEKEITNIINPSGMPEIGEAYSFSGFEGETLITQTPEIALKTILISLGIESGAFVIVSPNKKIQIIAQKGGIFKKLDIEKIIEEAERENSHRIIKNFERKRENSIRNLMVIPAIYYPTFKIYGIFANKKPTVFSPTNYFSIEEINIVETLSLQAIVAIQNARLNIALKETQLETIFRLSVAIEYRDRETGMHIHRVSEYAGIIAEGIGLKEGEVELIKNAMPLHDIGKIAIPDRILLKPGKLTEEERKIVEKHPIIGAKMLEGSNSLILKASEIIALYHHEKYDGTGYPMGLKGTSIPLYGRIAALSDIFDALSSKRIYKKALDIEESFNIVKEEAGRAFDPAIVKSFIERKEKIIEIYEKYQEKEKSIFSYL